ncbi:unnamed protein product [Brachionus calyciflorus]|uniref:Cytochrome p450 n=1 Tax=Brachionus calyciflorus TaxID=104777 RepID=A0A814LZP1_9BILA|nr:unnamed protein product [Brachionus calyciflorus]
MGFLELFNSIKETTFVLAITAFALITTRLALKWLNMNFYFSKLKIPGPRPLPILGNFYDVIKRGLPYNDLALIKKYGRTIGYFEGTTPVVLTADSKFIKSILIKDFKTFANRKLIGAANIAPFNKFVSLMKDDEWKSVRAILSTMFTSGKLKSMSKLMNECVNQTIEHFQKIADNDEVFDSKKYFGGLSLNVICSCCLGIGVDSIKEPDMEFLKHIKKFFFDEGSVDVRLVLITLFPKFIEFVAKSGLMPMDSLDYLRNLNLQIIERRKQKLEHRDDFIQIMLEHEEQVNTNEISANEESDIKWNEKYLRKALSPEEIFSQSMMFLLAGYETTANTLSFIAYNLARHPEVQNKLIEEVEDVLANHNGDVNYDSVNDMKYMNMVIDETLRIFPTAVRLDRIASENYEFEGMKIVKDQQIIVPIWAIHHDPEKIDSNTYLPFGIGPRNCLGMRFALLNIKLCIAKVLTRFQFETCDQTLKTIEIDSSGLGRSKEPVYLKIKNRF